MRILLVCYFLLFILVGGVLGVSSFADDRSSESAASKYFLPEVGVGDESAAPLKVVMYHSLNCPHCKIFKIERFPDFKKKYIDTKKVYFVFQDFPIDRFSVYIAKLTWANKDDLKKHKKYANIITKNFRIDETPVEVDWFNDEKSFNPDSPLLHKLMDLLGKKDGLTEEGAHQLEKVILLLEKHGMTEEEALHALMDQEVEDSILRSAMVAQNVYGLEFAPGFLLLDNESIGLENPKNMVGMEELNKKIDETLEKLEDLNKDPYSSERS